MAITVRHKKTNEIPDWTASQLASVVAGNAPPGLPAGTVLADIVLPSDWNDTHEIEGIDGVFVPYTGATASVDLGAHSLTAQGLVSTNEYVNTLDAANSSLFLGSVFGTPGANLNSIWLGLRNGGGTTITGTNNCIVGIECLFNGSSMSNWLVFGNLSGGQVAFNTQGGCLVGIGADSISDAGYVTAIGNGASAGQEATSVGADSTSASKGVAVGSQAYAYTEGLAIGRLSKAPQRSVCIGESAGASLTASDIYNVLIGWGCGQTLTGVNNQLRIGKDGFDLVEGSFAAQTLQVNGVLTASNLSGTNTGDQNLSGLVPYTGATGAVNLGLFGISAASATLTGALSAASGVFSGTLTASNLSGTNTGDQNLSGLVPYTGATGAVNLGLFGISAASATLTGTLSADLLSAAGAVISGDIIASSGFFSADLSAATGTFSDAVQAVTLRSTNRTTCLTFTMTNGAGSSKLLQSDASGNATWATITSGRILFGGSGGGWLTDSFLFWNDTSNRLGVNVTAPAYTLDVGGTIRTTDSVMLFKTGANESICITNNITTHTANLRNTIIGQGAGNNTISGNRNVILGAGAATSLTSGAYNNIIGDLVGTGLTTGSYNCAVGANAISGNLSYVCLFGHNAKSGDNGASFGATAGQNCTGAGNTNIGFGAGLANTSGTDNVFVGNAAGYGTSTGASSSNTSVGASSMRNLTTGANQNSCFGSEAGYGITTGQRNVCIGFQAGKSSITTQSDLLIVANSTTTNPLIYATFPNVNFKVSASQSIFTSTAGGGNFNSVFNVYEATTNTNASAGLTIEQGSTGDSVIQFLLTAGQRFVVGIDNSDGDAFKIQSSLNLGNSQLKITPAGDVIVGNAALATSATAGFLYIPTCAGTPTGVPTGAAGMVPVIYDTTNNKMYVYNGSWKGSGVFA